MPRNESEVTVGMRALPYECQNSKPYGIGDGNFELQPKDDERRTRNMVALAPVLTVHNLRTTSLMDIKFPPAQARRMARAINRHKKTRRRIVMTALPSLGVAEAPTPTWSGEGRDTACQRKRCNRRRIGAQLSKKGLVHALRKIVRVRNTRRLQERASFARALHKASRTINSDDGDGDSAAISSIKSSSSMASPHNWLQLSTDDSSSVTSIISPFATGSSNRSNILLEECSVKPFVSLMKILRLASDVPGGLPDSKFKSSGVLSSVNYEDSRTFPTRGLAEGFTLHGKRGNEAGNISFDCVEKMSHSLVGGGLTDHHLYYSDDDVLPLCDVGKIEDSLTGLRARAMFSLPRHSPSRGRIAAARIDSIMRALIADGSMDGSKGGSGSRSFKGDRSGDKAPSLNSADVRTVVAHMDTDQSGEVDAKELEVAISAAKQGKLKDAQLTHCMLKIDNELHLWHLRICDLFDRLDADGSGTLSCEELTKGLSMLCGHDRNEIIQRRQELRRRNEEKKAQEIERRAHVMGFVSNMESLPEEMMQDREFFAADVTDKETFHELLKRISRKVNEEVMDDATICRMSDQSSDDDGQDGGGSLVEGADGNMVHRRRTSRSTTNVLGAVEAQLERLKESLLLRRVRVTVGQNSRLEKAEQTEMAGGTVQLAGIVGRGRSAVISKAAAVATFANSPMKMKMETVMSSPACSSDEEAGKAGGLRGESKPNTWSSPSGAVNARTGQSREDPKSHSWSLPAGRDATKKTTVIAVDSGTPRRVMSQKGMVERQMVCDPNDRFLRVYLQRRFESERLPRLFSERSKSRSRGYAVNDAFEMVRKQVGRMPRVV